jgi:hypothetical protein
MKKAILFITIIVLLSPESNCQWYIKKYGVKDLNQLSQEQLTEASIIKKKQISADIALIGMSPIFIVGGISLVNYALNQLVLVDKLTFFKFHWYGFLAIIGRGLVLAGSGIGIYGLVFLPVHLSQRSEINKIIQSTKIKIGLIPYPTNNVFNCSTKSQVPGISITVFF